MHMHASHGFHPPSSITAVLRMRPRAGAAAQPRDRAQPVQPRDIVVSLRLRHADSEADAAAASFIISEELKFKFVLCTEAPTEATTSENNS